MGNNVIKDPILWENFLLKKTSKGNWVRKWSFKKAMWTDVQVNTKIIVYKKYFDIWKLKSRFTIISLCKRFNVTRRSYYFWVKNNKPIFKYKENLEFNRLVLEAYKAEKGKYGYPRLTPLMVHLYIWV